jgi:hypothetical protein
LAAQDFFKATMRELDEVQASFVRLSERRCDEETFKRILDAVLPEPRRPRGVEQNPGLKRMWERRAAEASAARSKISELRVSGKGMQLAGARGTFWGVLNAILEFVDHHREVKGSRMAYALLGDGMDLKTRAFRTVQNELAKAA